MELIGILIVIVGFALKFNTIAVVVTAGVVTGLVADMSIMEILNTLGSSFISQRNMTLFLLTLPVVGVCERYGLKDKAIDLISKVKNLSVGRLLTLYLLIRETAAAASVRLGGHPQFIRPLINPMAQGAAISAYGEIDDKTEDKIKAAAASVENYGNFFGQNVFLGNSGVLLIAGTLETLGYTVNTLDIAKASIPVAIAAFLLAAVQCYLLDKSLSKKYQKN